jgi:hypothetical protein
MYTKYFTWIKYWMLIDFVGYNIKINVKQIGYSGMNWNYLAQDKDQWRARLNTVIKLYCGILLHSSIYYNIITVLVQLLFNSQVLKHFKTSG